MTKLRNGLTAQREAQHLTLYKHGNLLKRVDLRNAVSRRLLIVELVLHLGASKTATAMALKISKQTIYNTLDTFERHGADGLLHSEKRGSGNKARAHEARRLQEKQTRAAQVTRQAALPLAHETPKQFTHTHDWQASRYAGGMIFTALLEKDWRFTDFFARAYGKLASVMLVFVQMLVHGVQSIEQLKAVKRREFGLVCGLKYAPSRQLFSSWLHAAAEKAQALVHIKQFFVNQLKAGLVSCYLMYVDGHFIPYAGKARVHKGYSTQRRLAMPGQTTIVFHDATGRIIYFQIEEGKGDIRHAIEACAASVRPHVSQTPLLIYDRESWGVEHFKQISRAAGLLTWEKNTNAAEINALPEELFSATFTLNDHRYRVYEFPDKQTYWDAEKKNSIALRRIVIWNLDSNRRPVCVSNDTREDASFLATAMLGRWGKSENGFKYMAERFNPHYIPLLQTTEDSAQQELDNPAYKELERQKQNFNKQLQKNATQLAQQEEAYNLDGGVRANSKRQRLLAARAKLENELAALHEKLQSTPARITLAEATNGRETFKVIDREGKNLFDLVQAMVWNARRTLLEMLRRHYHDERDVVNLLDHISRGHGWIKVTATTVHVRLEPMDAPRYRAAQTELCASLNHLRVRLPNRKRLRFSVGPAPTGL